MPLADQPDFQLLNFRSPKSATDHSAAARQQDDHATGDR
jgi:hypothetical protein